MVPLFKVRAFVGALSIAGMVVAGAASATVATFYDGITDGVAAFDSTVTAAGGTVQSNTWSGITSGTSVDFGDYTLTRNDGGTISSTTYGTMSGEVIGINPSGGGSTPRTDPEDYFDSGFTLTFDSAVNAVGFEVGDWATCCFDPTTDLFMSFDGGDPIQVATASQSSDGQFTSQTTGNSAYEIFVGAADDSGSFTSVSFWGNGIGEYLVAGGQVRWGMVDEGSLPPQVPGVPLPATAWMLMAGVGLLGAGKARRKKA